MKPDIKNFIDELNIPFDYKLVNGEYIFDLLNDTNFSDLYSQFSTDPLFSLDDDTTADHDTAKFIFYTDWFEAQFTADFKNDTYLLVVGDR